MSIRTRITIYISFVDNHYAKRASSIVVYVYTYMHTCTYGYVGGSNYTHEYVRVCIYVWLVECGTCVHVVKFIWAYPCIQTYACVFAHIHTSISLSVYVFIVSFRDVHTHVCERVYVWTCVLVCVSMHVCICVRVSAFSWCTSMCVYTCDALHW